MSPCTRLKGCLLPTLIVASGLCAFERAYGIFHRWEIRQIYSNTDGSVQYIKLFNPSPNEEFVSGQTIFTHRDDGQDQRSYTFQSNLDTGGESTAGRFMLLATGPIEGVEPDFVIPENFLHVEFEENATFDMEAMAWGSPHNIVTYDFIPTDGFRSLDRDGNIVDPATVANFAGDTAELTPPPAPQAPELLNVAFADGAFKFSFTAQPDHTYTVEYVDTLDGPPDTLEWQTLEVVEGDGEPVGISDPAPGEPSRFYRVKVE